MHKYMRAIGFSDRTEREKVKELLKDVIMNSDNRSYSMNTENVLLGDFCKNFAPNLGIAVCGEFDPDDKFVYEYYFPYLAGIGITSVEDISVERHAEKESFAGICDDIKVGISIIFYLQNRIPYVKAQSTGNLPVKGTSVTISGLSISGNVLLPLQKDESEVEYMKEKQSKRRELILAARNGSEEAIETLTMADMDMYTAISKRVQSDDIFTMVDTYLMPYGVECDQYSVLGEIVGIRKVVNNVTNEEVYILYLSCNDITFDICINKLDLVGEPQVGRRFKGIVWLQGFINFPEEEVI